VSDGRVFLKNNNGLIHTSPDLEPDQRRPFAGRRQSRSDYGCGACAETTTPQTTKKVEPAFQRFYLPMSRSSFGQRFERFGLELSILLQQNFYFALSLFQFIPAGRGKLHALFKESQRFFERDLSLLQFLHDLFQSLQTLFELGQRFNSLSFY
jgi:hypothetical protein